MQIKKNKSWYGDLYVIRTREDLKKLNSMLDHVSGVREDSLLCTREAHDKGWAWQAQLRNDNRPVGYYFVKIDKSLIKEHFDTEVELGWWGQTYHAHEFIL